MADQQAFLAIIQQAAQQGAVFAQEEPLFPEIDNQARIHTLTHRSHEEQEQILAEFCTEARPINLQVHRCTTAIEAGRQIAALAKTREPEFSTTKEIIMHDHPLLHRLALDHALADQPIQLHVSQALAPDIREKTLRSYIGITAPEWAVADSASVVQYTASGQPRSTSLVPSIHIAVLRLSQILNNLEEAYTMIRHARPERSMTFISGPSKTADIEAHMVHGAHGPREMHLLVLDEEQER